MTELASPTLTHVALHVPDLAASIAFFERYCGLRLVHERGEVGARGRTVWLAEEGQEQEHFLSSQPIAAPCW